MIPAVVRCTPPAPIHGLPTTLSAGVGLTKCLFAAANALHPTIRKQATTVRRAKRKGLVSMDLDSPLFVSQQQARTNKKKAASSRRMKPLIKPNRNYPLRTRRRCAMNAPPTAVMPISAKVVGSGNRDHVLRRRDNVVVVKAVSETSEACGLTVVDWRINVPMLAPVIDSVIWASK